MAIPVQLFFPRQQLRADGSASCLAERFVMVNLNPRPTRTDIFERGTPVRAVVMQGGTILTGDTTVQMETGGSVMLGFAKPLRKLQSRESVRIPFTATFEYRPTVAESGTDWRAAQLRDISVGGLGFVVDHPGGTDCQPAVAEGADLEIALHLPEGCGDAAAMSPPAGGPAPDEHATFRVVARGRVAWASATAGSVSVGIQFTRIATTARLRLADFIAERLPPE